MTTWTHAQFDSMSWHDNHVHAVRIVEGQHGSGDVLLDLDYIVEWLRGTDGRVQFRVVPAILRFHEVVNLRIALDYAAASAALGPFSLHAIERRIDARPRYEAQVWTLKINWPVGEITFEAAGYEQRTTGAEVIADQQWLPLSQRPASV